MVTRTIGVEHLPLLDQLMEVLYAEPDGVKQQIAIELLMAAHAERVGRQHDFIIDSMAKHAKQLSRSPIEAMHGYDGPGYGKSLMLEVLLDRFFKVPTTGK